MYSPVHQQPEDPGMDVSSMASLVSPFHGSYTTHNMTGSELMITAQLTRPISVQEAYKQLAHLPSGSDVTFYAGGNLTLVTPAPNTHGRNASWQISIWAGRLLILYFMLHLAVAHYWPPDATWKSLLIKWLSSSETK